MRLDDRFLAKLLDDPTDDVTRLVYADWLEEQDNPTADAQAEFLRLTVEAVKSAARKGERKTRRQRLQQLAADLDPEWLAMVSRLSIENCHANKEQRNLGMRMVTFDRPCERGWEQLRPTDDPAVRYCDDCAKQVHYCDTIMVAREHAWKGHCIAVDLGVIRRKEDLEPERMWLGRPSVETLREEKERMQPDAVSAVRERRKRDQKKAERMATFRSALDKVAGRAQKEGDQL
jgi:uncharacterized protein (TIGR02996 family)